MANEFVARNGLIAQNNSTVTGSLIVTNGITGSLLGTSSYSLNALALSSSYVIDSASFDYRINELTSASYDSSVISVDVATSASLRASTYYNGLANDGIGATLTSNINGALGTIDGVNTLLNWRLLIKNQATQLQNGVYQLTQTGSTVAPFILTRTTDSDESSEFSTQVVVPTFGTLNAGGLFAQTTDSPIIGTSSISYTQISGSNYIFQQISATAQVTNGIPLYTSTAKQLTKGSSTFTYDATNGIFKIRNVSYTYPSAQGANNAVLTNNGSGVLSWKTTFTGSVLGTASYSNNALTSSYALNADLLDGKDSTIFATTGSNIFNGTQTINGNVTINGTASIDYLNVTYESSSVIYSSGSNQLGDATNDTQLLIGRTIISGSLEVTGSTNIPSITGSLLGTASYASQTLSSSYASTASYVQNAQTASYVLNAISSSFSTTSSYAVTASYVANASSFPYTGSAIITGSLTVTGSSNLPSITGSLLGTASYTNQALSSSFSSTASYVNPLNQNVSLTGGISASSYIYSTLDLDAGRDLRSNYSSGDEGGQIFLNKAVTNTSIDTGINIDVYQNKLRIFEAGGTSRGGYWDITTLGAGASTNLAGGTTDTGSLLTTASVSLNTITFTKGNGTTFPITVNTGSGGGGTPSPTIGLFNYYNFI